MTNLLVRATSSSTSVNAPPTQASSRIRFVALSGAVAGGAAALIGMLLLTAVSVAGWFAADSGTFTDAVRVGGLAWLVSIGSGLQLTSASISLVPLGAVALNGWVLHRAGRWVGGRVPEATWSELAVGAGTLAATYSLISGVTALATGSPTAWAGIGRSVIAALLVAMAFAGIGTLRGADRLAVLFAALPEEVRAAAIGGAAGLLALLAGSAMVLASSLLMHFWTAVTLAEQMHAGLVGGAIAALVAMAFVPNAVLCAGSYVTGPGFSVGTGSVVDPGSAPSGDLPGFPLLAAVPSSSTSVWLETGLLVLPVLAGALAGLLAVRRFSVSSLAAATVRGGLAGLTTGGTFGALAVLSVGGIGPGRMATFGPQPGVVLASGLVCLVAGVAAAAVSRVVEARRG